MIQGSIIIADKSIIFRAGLKKIIQDLEHIDVIEIDDINHLHRKLKKIIPDVIIIGSDLNDDLLNLLKTKWSKFSDQIIVIQKEFDSSFQLYENYAQLHLNDSLETIKKVISNKAISENNSNEKTQIISELSKREVTILREIALGKTSKEIADELFISTHTVLTHRKNINKKLEIKTASGLTVYAILNNIINLDELEQSNK